MGQYSVGNGNYLGSGECCALAIAAVSYLRGICYFVFGFCTYSLRVYRAGVFDEYCADYRTDVSVVYFFYDYRSQNDYVDTKGTVFCRVSGGFCRDDFALE